MIAEIGTIPIVHFPKMLKFLSKPEIGIPPDIIYDTPSNTVWAANVAISAGIPTVETMNPLSTPISVAAVIEIITATHILTPRFTIR